MANTILGYEVASPEQQRKTALAILGFVGVMAIAGIGILLLISHWEQSGRQQAIAKIVSFETKCRYVVRNIGKRVSYYDHTGYIGCSQARAVANANNHPLGRVQQRTLAVVDFKTTEGAQLRTNVALHGDARYSVGQQVEILYRTENPRDVSEFKDIPLFGKDSLAPAPEAAAPAPEAAPSVTIAPTAEVEQVAGETTEATAQKPPASETVSESTKFWIGLVAFVVMVLVALWFARLVYRMVKRLIFGPRNDISAGPAASQPISSARMSAVTRRPAQTTFGQQRN